MDSDEHQIYRYLKERRREYLSIREICRMAGGKKRFRDEPEWAKPALARMVKRGIAEMDAAGHYRLRPPEKKAGQVESQVASHKEDNNTKRWISPQIQGILRKSGKDFSEVLLAEDDLDSYYDSL